MPVPVCRTVQEAYDAGRADALAMPAAGPQLAAMVAELNTPWLEQIAGQGRRLRTVAEAAAQLGIGKVKFYELIKSGELATVELPTPGDGRARRRVGQAGPRASHRVEEAEIDAFIERNRQPRAGSR